MIAELARILLPVFCVTAVGYAWRRLGFPFEREFVTRIIMNVAGPSLVVDSLSRLTLPLDEFLAMVAGAAAVLLAMMALGFALLRLLKLSIRSYLPSLAIGNTGNMGLPLCLFAFGEQGLGLAVAVYVTNSVGQFTLVPMLQSRASAARALLTTPVVYGALVGMLLLVTGTRLPEWAGSTVGLLGDLMIPLMLLALGNTLGGLHAARLPFAMGFSIARLVLALTVTLAVAKLLRLEGIALGVLVLQGTMPTAVFNYLFAARHDREPEDVASIVLVSTFTTAVLLPFLVTYALWLAR